MKKYIIFLIKMYNAKNKKYQNTKKYQNAKE